MPTTDYKEIIDRYAQRLTYNGMEIKLVFEGDVKYIIEDVLATLQQSTVKVEKK